MDSNGRWKDRIENFLLTQQTTEEAFEARIHMISAGSSNLFLINNKSNVFGLRYAELGVVQLRQLEIAGDKDISGWSEYSSTKVGA